jgi:hypothetical protein
MNGIVLVGDVCRGLVRKRGGVTIPLQDMFAHQMGRFHLIGPLEEFIKRSKDAFPSRYLDACQDPSDTFRDIMAACRTDKDAHPLAAIFHGVVRFTISSVEPSPACGIHLATREDVITSIHSAGYASADNLAGWPADYFSESLCQQCGHAHGRIKRFHLEEAPKVWAFEFVGHLCQRVFIPLHFRVPQSDGGSIATYVLVSYAAVTWVLPEASGKGKCVSQRREDSC